MEVVLAYHNWELLSLVIWKIVERQSQYTRNISKRWNENTIREILPYTLMAMRRSTVQPLTAPFPLLTSGHCSSKKLTMLSMMSPWTTTSSSPVTELPQEKRVANCLLAFLGSISENEGICNINFYSVIGPEWAAGGGDFKNIASIENACYF